MSFVYSSSLPYSSIGGNGLVEVRKTTWGMDRVDMDHVFQGIWIGGRSVLRSSILLKHDIHNVVNMAMELMEGAGLGLVDWNDLRRNGIAVQHVPLDDTPMQPIIPPSFAMHNALEFIHECVTTGSPVLVNCAMGISRSTSMVMAYLMLYQQMSYREALGIVMSGRPKANPNPGFRQQLQQLEGNSKVIQGREWTMAAPYVRHVYDDSFDYGYQRIQQPVSRRSAFLSRLRQF